uniref:Uncharacterized protein n=1 Tax=Timema poppense TaxID=170557 RepID=A0A7R9HH15_TIMPO|nr:unnamed protein product [Timema poppensis]
MESPWMMGGGTRPRCPGTDQQ